ncbi:MAG: class I SAM-dependent methyltransferase [Methanospirillum sp.]|nr:class I SAM-dependent methyltransferase [Methanospirillum sp.]
MKGRLWGNSPLEETAGTGEGVFLDLGCGDGKNLRRALTPGKFLIGIDFSLEAILLCKKDPCLLDILFICADARYLPLKNQVADSADAHHLIGHLEKQDRDRVAGEISRVLCPKGRLVVTVFGREDLRYGKGNEIEPGTFMKGTGILVHFFTHDELVSLFTCLICISGVMRTWQMQVRGKQVHRALYVMQYIKPERTMKEIPDLSP